MEKRGNRNVKARTVSTMVLPGLFLLALMLLLPAFATASGDPSGDAKLQGMKTDIQACRQLGHSGRTALQSFSKKYDVPMDKLHKTANTSGLWEFVCALEYVTVAGAAVWEARKTLDNYDKGNAYIYCYTYSNVCDHYNWRQGCLK